MLYYKVSFFIGAVTSFVIAGAILFRGQDGALNKRFATLVLAGAVWSLGFYFLASSQTREEALFWRWFMESGATLLPAFWLHFVFSFLNISKNKSNIIISSTYGISILIWILNLLDFLYFPGIFESNMAQMFEFKYYAIAGVGYYLFFTYFSFTIMYSLYVLYRNLGGSQPGKATQIKYIFIAAALGFSGGGMTFLPTIGVHVQPYGVILFAVYPVIIAYAILKYQLFNLKLVLVEIALVLLNFFLFINIFLSHGTGNFVINIAIFVGILLFSGLLLRGIYKDIKDRERIEQLAYEMTVANERLQVMEQSKTEFVSIASHQLRTPLTVIKGYASMILEGTFGTLTQSAQGAMDKLYESSEKIVALVEDLLTVSRLEQGRLALAFKPINFADFIRGVLAEEENAVKETGLELSLSVDDKGYWVSIDEKKFKQVIKHILDNAVKYTEAPGAINFTITDDSIAKKVRLAVSDTGVGMTDEQIKDLFERFDLKQTVEAKIAVAAQMEKKNVIDEKTETEMSDKKTPGIGLYIAREIIQAHKGSIHAHSAGANKGTTFIIELPQVAKPAGE